jgi:hypothetical protein
MAYLDDIIIYLNSVEEYKEYIKYVMDLKILVVLVIRLLKRDFNRLVNGMESVELWDEG